MASEIGLKVSSFDSTKELGGKTAYIDAEALASIGAESGDCIEIKGKRTIACVAAESDEKGAIKLDSLSRKSVGVSVGGFVTVRRCCPKPAAKIRLCPDASSISEIRMDEEDLKKLFRNRLEGRPLCRGMQLRLNGGLLLGKNSVFSVLSTSPEGIVAADGNTEITVEDRPASRDVMFSSIGGLREEIELIRENIEIPLKNPEIFRYMHIEPPRGILLCGPPGPGRPCSPEPRRTSPGRTSSW